MKLVIFKIKINRQLSEELDARLENNLEGVGTRYTPVLIVHRQGIPNEWLGWLLFDTFMFFITILQQIYLTLSYYFHNKSVTWEISISTLSTYFELIYFISFLSYFIRAPKVTSNRSVTIKMIAIDYLR